MKKAGYALGYTAVLWLLFALWVRVMTIGDVGPAMRPYYDALGPMLALPVVWLILAAALACGAIVRLFCGKCSGAEKSAALVLALLCLIGVFGWTVITALVAAA